MGIDEVEMGEFAYDYVGIERELKLGGAENGVYASGVEEGVELQERRSDSQRQYPFGPGSEKMSPTLSSRQ